MRLLSRFQPYMDAALSFVRSARAGTEAAQGDTTVIPCGVRLTPAKGHVCILSQRRQAKKLLQKLVPELRSGRQWTKYRKWIKRTQGVDYLTLPTYRLSS